MSTAAARKRRTKQIVKELLAKDFVKLAAKRDAKLFTVARINTSLTEVYFFQF